MLDEELRVLVWNQRAEDLWGVRQDEVQGQHFLNLDIGLPVGQLRHTIKACLNGENGSEVAVDAINRRGKPIRCQVTCTPLAGPDKEARGVILMMEESGPEKSP